jgi:hypothetical protein
MTIELDHLKIPSRNRAASAELLARILGVPWSAHGVGPFCPVYVNDRLTLDFDETPESDMSVEHYCFRLGEGDFDALMHRLAELRLPFRSLPHGPVDMQVNTARGGRIVYWSEPDGHVWEALTVSYARPLPAHERNAR